MDWKFDNSTFPKPEDEVPKTETQPACGSEKSPELKRQRTENDGTKWIDFLPEESLQRDISFPTKKEFYHQELQTIHNHSNTECDNESSFMKQNGEENRTKMCSDNEQLQEENRSILQQKSKEDEMENMKENSTPLTCVNTEVSKDVYEINEDDHNSEPLSPLYKLKKETTRSNMHNSEKTLRIQRERMTLQTRVAYIFSDNYIKVCDEMIRVAGRAGMVHALIEAYGLLKFMDLVPPREVTGSELLKFHSADYIQFLEKISSQEDEEKYDEEAEIYGLTYDCPVHYGVYDYAVLVSGGTVRAAELLVDGSCDVAINWGGGWHHAKRDSASGFCYFNDIALGILKLREQYERVLYVDIDLHHGDGVEDAFCTTSKVLTVSFHKYLAGFFPGSGSISDVGVSKGRNYSINVPLLDGIKDTEFFALFNRVMAKVRERFKPLAVVCQCGADGLAGDPMESFNLTPLSLARCVYTLKGWKVPLLILGGGGYNFVNTAKCWALITSVIVGKKLPDDIPDHKFFTKYGPDYELSVSVGNRKDSNTKEYLGKVYRQVIENINKIQCDGSK